MADKICNSAIIYDGWRDSAELLAKKDKALAYDYLMAILDTQFYGERDKSDPVLEALMVNVDFSLVRQAEKRASASNGGNSAVHNRMNPYALIYHLRKVMNLPVKQVASIALCSERTVRNAVNEVEKLLEDGASLEAMMRDEQQDAKYEEAYANYFAHMKSTLL